MKKRRGPSIARNDEGATMVIVAVLSIVLLGAAAMAIDISRFTYQRQLTQNALESGAQAGAFYLPASPNAAIAAARSAARFVDAQSNPTITPYCVVPYTGVVPNTTNAKTFDTSTVSSYCTPGVTAAQLSTAYAAVRCNSVICSLPCTLISGAAPAGVSCNTLGLAETRAVNYLFGPAMKVFSASFGGSTHIAAACRGSGCAASAPNPMNVVVLTDRTGSLSDTNLTAMIAAIRSMLKVMTPAQQFVALSTLGPSLPPAATTGTTCAKVGRTLPASKNNTVGSIWVPIDFTNDYLTGPGVLNTTSTLTKWGLNCMDPALGNVTKSSGTFLAAALKYAARYLLGIDKNNLINLPSTRSTPITKAIIFETDGAPQESTEFLETKPPAQSTFTTTSTQVLESNTFPWNSSATTACDNFKQVAARAKAQGILIITVGFNVAGKACGSQSIPAVLAAAASANSSGVPSAASATGACTTTAITVNGVSTTDVAVENSDGDYFYCAAGGSDMAGIFASAFSQLVARSRFIALP